ncbi:hypothetical protein [Runella sp.]|jgi:hypothetical protein|uniref:hypothetical protein n=1 Tax=Runella sp. TaxID=1960881 RepID=UPI002607ACC3|nr:hypothetical protein [Runella sp.]
MKLQILLPCIAAFAITACNNTTANNAEKSTSETPKTEAVSTSGNADCLKSHADKGILDQLLPLEVIKKHYDVPAQAKKDYSYSPEAKKHDKDTYEYTWDSGRVRKIKMMGQEMEYPSPNRVGLRWVGSDLFMITGKSTPLESFKAFYRNTTAAEKEAAFKKAGEAMKEKGYDAKTTETATNMAKDLSTDQITFKEITGVGEAASWRIKEKELTVLVGKVTFQVSVEISANDDENIALAKKLAAEVLAKCK